MGPFGPGWKREGPLGAQRGFTLFLSRTGVFPFPFLGYLGFLPLGGGPPFIPLGVVKALFWGYLRLTRFYSGHSFFGGFYLTSFENLFLKKEKGVEPKGVIVSTLGRRIPQKRWLRLDWFLPHLTRRNLL